MITPLVEILPFGSIKGTCVKCGRDYLSSPPHYCGGCIVSDGIELIHEHLHRSCPTCGYTWMESCADFEAKQA